MTPSKNRVEAMTRGKVNFQGPDFHLVQEMSESQCVFSLNLQQRKTIQCRSIKPQGDNYVACGYLTQPPRKEDYENHEIYRSCLAGYVGPLVRRSRSNLVPYYDECNLHRS